MTPQESAVAFVGSLRDIQRGRIVARIERLEAERERLLAEIRADPGIPIRPWAAQWGNVERGIPSAQADLAKHDAETASIKETILGASA